MSYWEGVSSDQSSDGPTEHIKTDPTVPAGFYVCEVVDFGAWPSKVDQDWNVKFAFRIIEGAHRDKHVVRWASMRPDRKKVNYILFSNTMGSLPVFDPEHGFADYASLRASVQGAVVKVKCEQWKSNGKSGLNVDVNQLVSPGGSTGSVDPEANPVGYTEDEAIPF